MNTIWSTYVQKADMLHRTRTLRFAEPFGAAYRAAFALDDGLDMLEVGCGTGALCQALRRWYPGAAITGLDRDSAFVQFAAGQATGVTFREGDATALPFTDGSFDVTLSNTVQEHVGPAAFFSEQRRVLRPGGVCLVLSSRRGIHATAPCLAVREDWEREIHERAKPYFDEADRRYNVCAYPMSEAELPAAMERYGFRHVSTHYVVADLTPDNPRYPSELAHAMIDANRQVALDWVASLPKVAPGVVSEDERAALTAAIHQRFDQRLTLYDRGERQWDTNVSVTMVVRGVK